MCVQVQNSLTVTWNMLEATESRLITKIWTTCLKHNTQDGACPFNYIISIHASQPTTTLNLALINSEHSFVHCTLSLEINNHKLT